MRATVFYSWQSDLPYDVGREPIQLALIAAIGLVADDATLIVRPELDFDTEGLPGSPSVVSAILRKIDESTVFVGDVTPTFKRFTEGAERISPNPNVLLELGYALKRLGRERILLVLNSAYGSPEQLPFDLRGDRIIPFRLGESSVLVERLRSAIHLVISKSGPPPDLLPPVEIRFDRRSDFGDGRRHEYRLSAMLKNVGNEVLDDWSIDIAFPHRVLLSRSVGSLSTERRGDHVVLRQTQANHSGPLYPESERELIVVDYFMDDEVYHSRGSLFDQDVTVSFYSGKRLIARKTQKFGELQNF